MMKRVSTRASQFKIGVGAVKIDKLGKKYVNDALSHNRLSYGFYSQEFEKKFAKIHESRFAIFCNSGTSALQVGFHALKRKYGWKDGSEVIVPALTFVASINTILQNKLKPVFVDVDPLYFGLDPKKIEAKITKKTVAIEPVHLFGQPCEMEPIMAMAKKHKLVVLEDACETMFVKYKGKMAGSFGDVACFSSYSAHIIVTGVGGFAVTSDTELAVIMKSLFNHGRDGIYLHIDDDDRVNKKKLGMIIERRFNFTDIGYSYRATELEAALGVAQLKKWPEILGRRQENTAYLTKKLASLSAFLQLPCVRPATEHAFMVYPIVVKDKRVNVFDLMMHLEEKGIETRYLLPTLTQPVYKNLFGDIARDYPVSLNASQRGFYIGCHQELTRKDLDYIVECFNEYLDNS